MQHPITLHLRSEASSPPKIPRIPPHKPPSSPFTPLPCPPPPFAWLVHFSLSSLVGALGGVSPSAAYKSLGLRAPVSPTLDPKLGSLFLLGRRAGSKKHGRACYRVRAGGIAAILRPWVTPWGHPRDPAGSVRLAMGTRWVRSSATFRCSEWADKSDDGIFSLVYSGRMEGEGDVNGEGEKRGGILNGSILDIWRWNFRTS